MVAIDFRINAVLSATQSIPSRKYQSAKLYSGDSGKKKVQSLIECQKYSRMALLSLVFALYLVKKFAPKFHRFFGRTKNNVR